MADVFAEVDEIMRQERIMKFWKDNGLFIVLTVIAIIVTTAAVSGYKSWNSHVRQRDTDILLTALDSADFPENFAKAPLGIRPDLEAMGQMSAAGAFIEEGQAQAALNLYTQVAENKGAADELRHLAILMQVRLMADNAASKVLLEKLEPVLSNEKAVWNPHARLEAASILARREGDFEAARTHLAAIMDMQNIPDTLVSKARALDHVYAVEQQGAESLQTGNEGS